MARPDVAVAAERHASSPAVAPQHLRIRSSHRARFVQSSAVVVGLVAPRPSAVPTEGPLGLLAGLVGLVELGRRRPSRQSSRIEVSAGVVLVGEGRLGEEAEGRD
jgi:hypothetical protein